MISSGYTCYHVASATISTSLDIAHDISATRHLHVGHCACYFKYSEIKLHRNIDNIIEEKINASWH